jgi:hypothetical protein
MALTFTMRQDANKYQEGLVVGDVIVRGLGKYSWLQPGISYAAYTLSDAGVLYLPKVSGTQGAATAICADGTVGTADVEYLNVLIDKKVSAKFDGCFTVASIADKTIERALNNYKMKNMQNDMQDDVLAYMLATGTASAVVKGTLKAYEYLRALQNEYFAANEEFPEVALVSMNFYDELLLEGISLGLPNEAEAYMNGNVGKVLGMNLVVVPRLTRDAVLYVPEALAIVKPASPKVIGENILGAVDSDTDAFYDGMVSIQSKDALKGTVETYVHKFYGKGIPIADRMLVTPVIV